MYSNMADGTPVRTMQRRSLRNSSKVRAENFENIDPYNSVEVKGKVQTPLTPIHNNLVYSLRQRLEKQMSEKADRSEADIDQTSPGLSTLRMTPGRKLKEKQNILMRKHDDAKNRTKTSCVGGGVSIWPQMDNMRLTRQDSWYLLIAAIITFTSVLSTFMMLHGTLMQHLTNFHVRLNQFNDIYMVDTVSSQDNFNKSILKWHTAFTALLEEIQATINTRLSKTPLFYQVYICFYVIGIGVLLYYIADNVLAKNRLTPRRIKIWICLLVAMGTWTLLMLQLLSLAQSVESNIERNVYHLSSILANMVYKDYDLMKYRDVLTYWQMRCLPPTAEGVLTILDLVAVRDISYYLQYYSLPIITALLTPVIKLIQALRDVYSVKPHG